MRYLLVNHIAAAPGRDPAHLILPANWARDLGAAARVANEVGFSLTVATPLADRAIPDGVEVVPDSLGFEHITLPFYNSARTFLHERKRLEATLGRAVQGCDVVQLDHGGYPISLGHVADPIAKTHGRDVVWVLSGSTLPLSTIGSTAGNLAKRFVGRSVDGRLRSSLLEHLSGSLLTICDFPALRGELTQSHQLDSTCIECVNVLDREVLSSSAIQARTRRLLDPNHTLRFIVTGEQNIVAGTDHVLRAMHRCLRLGAACELTILGDGVERDALLKLAESMQMSSFVRLSGDPKALDEADVWVNAALTRAAEQAVDPYMARGLVPIVAREAAATSHVVTVPHGASEDLTAALFEAVMQRDRLVARVLGGVEYVRTRTLEAAYRKRFKAVRTAKGDRLLATGTR